MNEIKGTLHLKGEVKQITDTFKKLEFVLLDSSSAEYPEYIQFQLVQDKCSKLDGINVGDNITIKYGVKGRKWTNPQGEDKYFNSLDAFFVAKENDVNETSYSSTFTATPTSVPKESDEESLPF